MAITCVIIYRYNNLISIDITKSVLYIRIFRRCILIDSCMLETTCNFIELI